MYTHGLNIFYHLFVSLLSKSENLKKANILNVIKRFLMFIKQYFIFFYFEIQYFSYLCNRIVHLLIRDVYVEIKNPLLQIIQDKIIGVVYRGFVQSREINPCCLFGIMPHTFTDYSNGDVFTFGDAGPGMAGNVHGQGG